MNAITTFTVANSYPPPFERMEELMTNLYWSWSPRLKQLFSRIDPELWNRFNHAPLRVMSIVARHRLLELAENRSFVEEYQECLAELDHYLGSPTWYSTHHGDRPETIAYFSAEFGIHESFPLYSGGLGVLSGDHTKSASDLGLPFVGVGLLYQMGYFSQRLSADGTQMESYTYNDPSTLPIVRIVDSDNRPVQIRLKLGEDELVVGAWRTRVGRVELILLDTNLPENGTPQLRDITGYLYGGDKEMRILQEIVLGIGGMRMLRALNIQPTVTHCNEGHSAFLLLERIRIAMQELQLQFDEACRLVAAGSVFTTHTPVPAGHDVFDGTMVERFLGTYREMLGLDHEAFMRLGRLYPDEATEGFSMTVLALRLTGGRNGVSQLHGDVSREMWSDVWPNFAPDETPIVGLTNGIHTRTFVADEFDQLFTTYIDQDWKERISDQKIWNGVHAIPDNELFDTKRQLRRHMIEYLRRRLLERQTETYTRSSMGRTLDSILDPDILTIGFARRFATYKRATLLFRDSERAYQLFTSQDRPVQLVMAGKAHPKDEAGKKFIREVFAFIRETGLEHRILFIEDYDIGIARAMVQGCDIWLNTPRRPMEASGTSGMKAAVNGTLNLSILDGWFPEAWDGTNGFAIGDTREFIDTTYQDEIESRSLYRVLEEEVLPMFYDRNGEDLPVRWIAAQKRTIETMAGEFSSDRMVQEYTERFYLPAGDRYRQLAAQNAEGARNLVAWLRHLKEVWNDLRVIDVQLDPSRRELASGESIRVTASIELGRVAPENIQVEAFIGPFDSNGVISHGRFHPLKLAGSERGGGRYEGIIELGEVGQTGLTIRIVPAHPSTIALPDTGLVTWG